MEITPMEGGTPGATHLRGLGRFGMSTPLDPVLDPDFMPATRTAGAQRLTRPSLSYWQDAWRRLQTNRQALVSLCIITFFLFFAAVGPLIYRVDSSAQDMGRISERPALGHSVLVLADPPEYVEIIAPGVPETPEPLAAGAAPAAPLGAPANLRLMNEPTISGVRLAWDPVPGASGYVVYRMLKKPTGANDLGVPQATIEGGNHVSYEDRFDLKPVPYFYTVVAKSPDAEIGEAAAFSTLAAELKPALALSDAQAISPEAQPGQSIAVPGHWLGTDALGRDILARLMTGARISLFIGFFAPLLATLLGLLVGGAAGFFGGRIDQWLMRFTDFVIALPFLLFMILFKVAFGTNAGESGIMPMLLAMVILSWTGPARLARGQILQLRESEFVQAARLLGARPVYLILRHLLPNTLGVILVSLTFAIPSAIFTEAFLSFIGMGVVPPTPSWGSMCNDGIQSFLVHPHEFLGPALAISLTVLAFNLLGDGLRDALDPKLRR